MGPSPRALRLMPIVLAVPCAIAVAVSGELSTGALVAVGSAGLLVAGAGIALRSGEAARPVGRRGRAWLVWIASAAAWELVTLAHDGLPSASDLADPVLASPVVRGAATVGWLAAGAWLISRPRRQPVRP